MGQDIATNTERERGESGEQPSLNTSPQLGHGQRTMGFY